MHSAVDCHFHVVGPLAQFPMLASRSYPPHEAPLSAWKATLGPLGITRGVLVQPSFYGTDNRGVLAALAQAGPALVGVGAVSQEVSETELDALAAAGVRGVRFAHFEPGDTRGLAGFVPLSALPSLAPRLRARSMHADLLTDSRLLPGIAELLRAAALPVVLDHMGRAPAHLGAAHSGIDALKSLLHEGWLWVKLSGIANISQQAPGYADAQAIHETLVAANPERLVWGSDWPHTRPHGELPRTAQLLERFMDWTPQERLREQILCENPEQLYRL